MMFSGNAIKRDIWDSDKEIRKRVISQQIATDILLIEICLVHMNSSCPYFVLLGRNTLRQKRILDKTILHTGERGSGATIWSPLLNDCKSANTLKTMLSITRHHTWREKQVR